MNDHSRLFAVNAVVFNSCGS